MRPLVRFLASPRVFAPANLAAPPQSRSSSSPTTSPPTTARCSSTRSPGPFAATSPPPCPAKCWTTSATSATRKQRPFLPLRPLACYLLTALFNVFPLPRLRDFQRSFTHAGEALDRGYHVLVFPEGTRSAAGQLAPVPPRHRPARQAIQYGRAARRHPRARRAQGARARLVPFRSYRSPRRRTDLLRPRRHRIRHHRPPPRPKWQGCCKARDRKRTAAFRQRDVPLFLIACSAFR